MSPGGRKRDPSLDGLILDAAIDLLAEVGFDRMTVDMIASRAHAGKATVYRRWVSKEALVLDAVDRLKHDLVDLDGLPDTGSLRADMLALFERNAAGETERKLRAVTGLAALLPLEPALSIAASDAIIGPWTKANRMLIERAIARGEVHTDVPIETLASILPSLGCFRVLVERKPFDRKFLLTMTDLVLLPALGIGSAVPPARLEDDA